MTSIRLPRSRLLLAALLAGGTVIAAAPAGSAVASAGVAASSERGLPPAARSAGIEYLTGGIGTAEARAIENAIDRYPLAIELVEKQAGTARDAFTADATVHIRTLAGKPVFEAAARGPFMLVRLEPGAYSLSATLSGRTLHREHVKIRKGHTTRETFVFPARTD